MKIFILAAVIACLACEEPKLPVIETGVENSSTSQIEGSASQVEEPAKVETKETDVEPEPKTETLLETETQVEGNEASSAQNPVGSSETAAENTDAVIQAFADAPPSNDQKDAAKRDENISEVVTPVQDTPITPPVQDTPISPPVQDIPITPLVQDTPISPPVQDIPTSPLKELEPSSLPPSSSSSKTLLIIFSISIITIVSLVGLSAFHRSYLARFKKAPIDAPVWLSCLFPKPRNYEKEMSKLCQKYLELKP